MTISQIEHDVIVDTLEEALKIIQERWGSYEKLGAWRKDMLNRCFGKFMHDHHEINNRYHIRTI